MDLSQLAAKQKRVKDWSNFLENEVQPSDLKGRTASKLKEYRNLLARCWQDQEISEKDELAILSLERDLVRLNEEARMRVVGKQAS